MVDTVRGTPKHVDDRNLVLAAVFGDLVAVVAGTICRQQSYFPSAPRTGPSPEVGNRSLGENREIHSVRDEPVDQGRAGRAGVATLGIHERIDDQGVLAGCEKFREARLRLGVTRGQVFWTLGQQLTFFQRATQRQIVTKRDHFLDLGAEAARRGRFGRYRFC